MKIALHRDSEIDTFQFEDMSRWENQEFALSGFVRSDPIVPSLDWKDEVLLRRLFSSADDLLSQYGLKVMI